MIRRTALSACSATHALDGVHDEAAVGIVHTPSHRPAMVRRTAPCACSATHAPEGVSRKVAVGIYLQSWRPQGPRSRCRCCASGRCPPQAARTKEAAELSVATASISDTAQGQFED